MADAILTLNAGSSSLKFSAFRADERLDLLLRGQIESLSTAPKFSAFDAENTLVGERSWTDAAALGAHGAIDFLLDWGKREGLRDHRLIAAGHRVVHGGTRFSRPVRIDDAVMRELQALVPLAPLHQPHNLAAISAVAKLAPSLPQIARFDTAFHRTMPPLAQAFAIPKAFADAGVRRYGFHGLSYEYVAGALANIDARAASGRTIVAHLGNGASLCALRDGKSIATTMAFTALDGLVMGTRCGAIDPGVLLYLQQSGGLSVDEIERLLYEQSGLLGVSGVSSDMRALVASHNPRAKEAIDLFVYRAAGEIGSLAAALEGLDAIVFTGGIGENSVAIRTAICAASRWLGVELNEAANAKSAQRISGVESRVSAFVIPTNEELMIARHTLSLLPVSRSSAVAHCTTTEADFAPGQ